MYNGSNHCAPKETRPKGVHSMIKAFQILAGILTLLGTLLIHNYTIAGFIFYSLAITFYLVSLFTHRKDELNKTINNEPPKDPYYHKR